MKKILSIMLLIAVSACSGVGNFTEETRINIYNDNPSKEPKTQTNFKVDRVTLSSHYRSRSTAPVVDNLMETSPDKLTREWMKSRFGSTKPGSPLKLVVFIKESSVTQKPVIRNGILDTEYAVYRANIDLEIKVQNGNQTVGAVFSKAFEERVVENYLSLPEKNKIWNDLIYTALEKADIEMQIGIDRYLNEYVSY